MNLEEIEDLMRDRDHSNLVNEVQRVSNLRALADEVPGLVNEVRRLNLQVGEVTAHRDRLRDLLNDIRGMILGARTVHEISELASRIMRRIEGPDEDAEKPDDEKRGEPAKVRNCNAHTGGAAPLFCHLNEGHPGKHLTGTLDRDIHF